MSGPTATEIANSWVVTGYGGSLPGLLCVVLANSEKGAREETVRWLNETTDATWILRDIFETQGDEPDSDTARIGVTYAFEDEIAFRAYNEATENTGWMPEIRYGCYRFEVQKIELNTNLKQAVIW